MVVQVRQYMLAVFILLCACFSHAKTFVVAYETPGADFLAVQSELKNLNTVSNTVAFVNEIFLLNEKLVLVFGGDDGPLYDSELNQIQIPYAFLQEVDERFEQTNYGKTGISPQKAAHDALMHTIFHELAHALIFMHEIPVLGKEEDAADNLATILLIEFFEEGRDIALSAADLFDLESSDREGFNDEDFWGEHSLDEQRYYSTLCMVYGSAPEQYSDLKETFSDERAELCIDEYALARNSWLSLLEPLMKQ